jgi:tape measure domain-containing protein
MPIEVGTAAIFDVSQPLAALDKLGAADTNLRNEQLKTNAAISQSFASVAQAVTQYDSQLGAILMDTRAASAEQRKFAGEIGGLVKEIRDQAAAQREAQRASAAAAAERRKASQEAREAAKAEKAAAKEVAAAEKEAAAAAKLAASEAAKAAQQAGKAGESTGALGKIFGSLQGQVAAAFSVAAVKAFIGNVVDAGQAAEATLSKLTFANGGNAQAAARDLAFLRAEADRLGLEVNATGKSYGSFVSAAAAGNFPLAEARKLFLATAGASATLKLSADDTQGVLLALTQILSKGTVSAEELRGQIGERLPGAFSIAARAIGVTEQQLNKLLQTGQLKSADFLPKFAEELQKTFGDGSAQAADSFTANLNRIENEFTAFFLRFQGTASAGVSKITTLFQRLNRSLDLRSPDGRQRLGEQQAQQGIKDYEGVLNGLLAQAEAQAKANNQAAGQASILLLARQRGALKEELAAARIEAKRIENLTPSQQLDFAGGLSGVREASVQAQRRVALLEGEIAKTIELAEARKKANSPKDLEGLVKRQEDLIKAIKARQLAATQENQGGGADFLLGKGGLNEQLKEAQKELDRLLGKVEKAAVDRLAAALRALATAREELQSKAAAAATKDADDQATRARLAFQEQLRQVEVIKQKLIEREAAVRKAGGRGANADGVIDGAQDDQLARLRIAALDTYYEELGKIERAREQRLFELRADSDAKEVESVNRKYDKLIEAAKDGIERQAIEEARQRDQLNLRAGQNQRESDRQATIGQSLAGVAGETFGPGTGISVYAAKRLEKQQLLDVEKKHAEDVLNNSLLLSTKEGEVQRAAAEQSLARVRQTQRALDIESKLAKFNIYSLIFGENDSPELRKALDEVATSVAQSLGSIVDSEEKAAAARAQTATQNINELTGQLAAQIQLNQEGSASNIKGLQDQIAQERVIRREALEDQRTAAKQKVVIDTLTQASSIATAAAEVFAAFASLGPLGFIGGIGAAGLLIGAFAAAKVEAYQAASQIGGGSFFKGGFTGAGDPTQESQALGAKPYTYHKGEFVFDHEKTGDLRHVLFEPIHGNRPQDIDWGHPAVAALLPDLELPEKLRAEKQAYVQHNIKLSGEAMKQDFDRLHSRLEAIEASNWQMADKPDRIPLGPNRIMEVSKNGSTHIKNLE